MNTPRSKTARYANWLCETSHRAEPGRTRLLDIEYREDLYGGIQQLADERDAAFSLLRRIDACFAGRDGMDVATEVAAFLGAHPEVH